MTPAAAIRDLGLWLVAAGGIACCSFVWRQPLLTPWLARHCARLDADLVFLRRPATGARIVAAQLTVAPALVLVSAATESGWLLAAVPIIIWLPRSWLHRQRTRRVAMLEAQLDPWLVALANALRGTPSLGDAIASTAAVISAPLREELEHALKECHFGVPLDRALDNAGSRMGSRAVSGALLTLRVARSSGGSVSACLESTAATLREMIRLDGIVRAKTAEGKGQALVISALPVPFFAMLHSLDPAFLTPLTATLAGRLLLSLAAVLWLAGVVMARRIVRLDL